jgi:glutaredoxin
MYIVYTIENCDFCVRTKNLLDEYNCEYTNIILNTNKKIKKFKDSTGLNTVPQIYREDGLFIGGYGKLVEYFHKKLSEDVSTMEEQREVNRSFDTKITLLDAKKRKLSLKDKLVGDKFS